MCCFGAGQAEKEANRTERTCRQRETRASVVFMLVLVCVMDVPYTSVHSLHRGLGSLYWHLSACTRGARGENEQK